MGKFLIKLSYRIGAAVGMFPWNNKTGYSFYQIIRYGIFNSVGIAFLLASYYSANVQDFKAHDISSNGFHTTFNIIFFYGILNHKGAWKDYFKLVKFLDKYLRNNNNTSNIKEITKITCWMFIITDTIICSVINRTTCPLTAVVVLFSALYKYLPMYVILILISETTILLSTKLQLYCERLEKFCNKTHIEKPDIYRKITILKKLYRNMYLIVFHINSVFGIPIFTFFLMSFNFFLWNVCDFTDIFDSKELWDLVYELLKVSVNIVSKIPSKKVF